MEDDATSCCWWTTAAGTWLASKNEATAAIKGFQARVEAQSDKKRRVLRTNRGGEFTSVEFGEYFTKHGVMRHLSTPYSSQQNEVVERRNQTVLGMARSMMKAKMSAELWGEAVSTTVFILNHAPTKSLKEMTPYDA